MVMSSLKHSKSRQFENRTLAWCPKSGHVWITDTQYFKYCPLNDNSNFAGVFIVTALHPSSTQVNTTIPSVGIDVNI